MSVRDATRRFAAPPARLARRGLVRARTAGVAGLLAALRGRRSRWLVGRRGCRARRRGRTPARATGRVTADWARFASRQSVFLTSHFDALHPRWLDSSHRIGTAYLHGRPGTPGVPEFDGCFETLRRRRDRMDACPGHPCRDARARPRRPASSQTVSFASRSGSTSSTFHSATRGSVRRHARRSGSRRRRSSWGRSRRTASASGKGWSRSSSRGRTRWCLPSNGSESRYPSSTSCSRDRLEGTFATSSSGSAIPYRHVLARTRAELGRAYHALDLYLVPSRQEGGPKAILEAMATGVPLVTTRVGQAQELVDDGRNGLIVDVEDSDALAARPSACTRTLRSLRRCVSRAVRPQSGTSSSVWTTSGRCSSKGS